MKTKIYNLLILSLLLVSCSDVDNTLNSLSSDKNGTLDIEITTSKFQSHAPQTRETSDEIPIPHQNLDDGDEVGLLFKNPDGTYITYKLTCQKNDNGQVSWVVEGNKQIQKKVNAKYVAYYPYSDAIKTFEDIKVDENKYRNFNYASIDYEQYKDLDFMSSDEKTVKSSDAMLSIELKHRCLLVAIRIPLRRYYLSNDEEYKFGYAIDKLSSINKNSYAYVNGNESYKYNYSAGGYGFILFPNSAIPRSNDKGLGIDAQISKNIGNSRYSIAYRKTLKRKFNAGEYVLFKPEGDQNYQPYKIHVGDLFLEDGSLIRNKDYWDKLKNTNPVVGLVVAVKDENKFYEDLTLDDGSKFTFHGLVISVYDQQINESDDYFYKRPIKDDKLGEFNVPQDKENGFLGYPFEDNKIYNSGYLRTKEIIAKIPSSAKSIFTTIRDNFIANHKVDNYDKTTGWFVPSICELLQFYHKFTGYDYKFAYKYYNAGKISENEYRYKLDYSKFSDEDNRANYTYVDDFSSDVDDFSRVSSYFFYRINKFLYAYPKLAAGKIKCETPKFGSSFQESIYSSNFLNGRMNHVGLDEYKTLVSYGYKESARARYMLAF